MRLNDLRGKRVLITHTVVQNIMGSTMVVMDVAKCLLGKGARVDVFCSAFGDPMSARFEELGINLIDDEFHEFYLGDYALVWVNSQVLPLSIVRQLTALEDSGETPIPPFVFYHMSSLAVCPDEMPYIYGMEERLSSLSLFVSDEARHVQEPYFDKTPKIGVFQNCAPEEFFSIDRSFDSSEPESILIVSNHAPEEVLAASELLKGEGKRVLHIGEGGDREEILSPSLLSSYDAVISIGKTVQFCLVSGTPVYVYDRFGGFGYLSDSTYAEAEKRNYSGRGGSRKTGEEIAGEIVSGFPGAVSFQQREKDRFRDLYSVEKALSRAFDGLSVRKINRLKPAFAKAVESAQRFGFRYYKIWAYNNFLKWKEWSDWKELENCRQKISNLEHEQGDSEKKIEALESKVNTLLTSKEYSVGRALLHPLDFAQRVVHRNR